MASVFNNGLVPEEHELEPYVGGWSVFFSLDDDWFVMRAKAPPPNPVAKFFSPRDKKTKAKPDIIQKVIKGLNSFAISNRRFMTNGRIY